MCKIVATRCTRAAWYASQTCCSAESKEHMGAVPVLTGSVTCFDNAWSVIVAGMLATSARRCGWRIPRWVCSTKRWLPLKEPPSDENTRNCPPRWSRSQTHLQTVGGLHAIRVSGVEVGWCLLRYVEHTSALHVTKNGTVTCWPDSSLGPSQVTERVSECRPHVSDAICMYSSQERHAQSSLFHRAHKTCAPQRRSDAT